MSARISSLFGKIQSMLGKIREGSPLEQADVWIRNNYYTKDKLEIRRLSGNLLAMDRCYINLTIVKQPSRDAAPSSKNESKNRDTPPQSSLFPLSARLKVETPDKNVQIDLSTIFNPRKEPDGHVKHPRRILIRGRAGVGKTTLCKKMVYDFIFYHSTWKKLFDRILWVPLRTLKRKPDKGYNLEGLFLRDFFLNAPNREVLAKELEKACMPPHLLELCSSSMAWMKFPRAWVRTARYTHSSSFS
jgi:hypothetical protein